MTESRDWLIETGYIAKTPKEQAQRLKVRTKGGKDKDLLEEIKKMESFNTWEELHG